MNRSKKNLKHYPKRSAAKPTELDAFKGTPMLHKSGQCEACGRYFYLNAFAHHCPKKQFRKFKNHLVIIDHLKFDSLREAQKYSQRCFLAAQRIIKDLQIHPSFELCVNGTKICKYVSDFAYTYNGKQIVEDIKGVETPAFKIKAKLFRALYPEYSLVITK
jgi:hypothetical protein